MHWDFAFWVEFSLMLADIWKTPLGFDQLDHRKRMIVIMLSRYYTTNVYLRTCMFSHVIAINNIISIHYVMRELSISVTEPEFSLRLPEMKSFKLNILKRTRWNKDENATNLTKYIPYPTHFTYWPARFPPGKIIPTNIPMH